ncbi:VanZ family protein [Nitrosomonas communis]|uniref:VanZ family protein n=1 Tax=Nitrosomonas communis TaxID=44574 RepID=UPI00148154AA
MICLHAISPIPEKPPDNPSIIHSIFLLFSSIIHNTLHMPAYALLAGICYRCLFPYFNHRIKMILILIMAGIYGALLK